jgi:hypothetical protein
MNNLPFSICTYNLGSRVDDYFLLCKHLDPSLSFKSKKEEDDFLLKYDNVQNRTTELLANTSEAYCLQEVADEDRPLIKSFKERNFEILHSTGTALFDTAIALDKNRFKDITNHSIIVQINPHFSKDAAIATATDIFTGERILFVSAHVPGFDFTKQVDDEDAAEGDLYCRAIVKKLSEIGSGTFHIMGADMNANPEKWNPRFEVLSQQRFQLHRTNSATNVNPKDSTEQEREIDFIFTKTSTSIWQKIKSIFFSTVQFNTAIKIQNSIGWNIDDNASDHLPVFIGISHTIKSSKIHQLWNATYHAVSSCFRAQQPQKAFHRDSIS